MRYILGCGIFAYPQFIFDLGLPHPWLFIITGLFIINYVDIIVFECYPGWLPSKTCWPSTGYFSLVQEDPLDFDFVGLGRYCCCCGIHLYICGTVLRCGAMSLSQVSLFRSRRPFTIRGLSKKSVMSTILSSMSGSESSKVLVFLG